MIDLSVGMLVCLFVCLFVCVFVCLPVCGHKNEYFEQVKNTGSLFLQCMSSK